MPTKKPDTAGEPGEKPDDNAKAGMHEDKPRIETPVASSPELATGSSSAPQDELRVFMVGLAVDPMKLGAFIKDRDAAMNAAGISEVDQVILKSGNPATIHARLCGQRFSLTPPVPAAPANDSAAGVTRPPGASELAAQSAVHTQPGFTNPPSQGSSTMFPNATLQPQIFPQVQPQVVQPQIFPQVHPQIVQPQIFPQVHPQIVQPQIFPQVHPQIVQPQIFPQVHPQIVQPQIFPQVHPQIVQPQIFPQVHPQIVQPQIFPQVHPQIVQPQIFPQVHPQLVTPSQPG